MKYAVVNWRTDVRLFFYTLEDAIEKYRAVRYIGDAADVYNIEEDKWVRVEVTFT